MKKDYQSYYTKSEPILAYMVSRLRPAENSRLLEPCAGDGVFIDAVLTAKSDLNVDAYELNPDAAQCLLTKYVNNHRVHVCHSDTLLDPNLILRMNMGGYYDYIIANPPYGAWQDYEKRDELKKLYPGLYVRETYGLFLYQALHLLKPGGRLVFIIPDTYLNLHMHKALRCSLFTEACIEEIALFPSSFFPGVNFGYSNLSIITLHRACKGERTEDNILTVSWGFQQVTELVRPADRVRQMHIRQGDLLDSIDYALFVTENTEYASLINRAAQRIGEIADCVTGIYSGNDKIFLRVISQETRNGAKYETVAKNLIYRGEKPPPLEGLKGKDCFVPIVKGGGVRFVKPDLWFLDWSVEAVRHYKTDIKARFQNSGYYFRKGIALPMVSSSNVTASLIENRLFDQSIVGIFPHNERYLYYLLGFFNSSLCTSLLRVINPSANNSANYVKKLPFVPPNTDELRRINEIVLQLIADIRKTGRYRESDLSLLNKQIEAIYFRKKGRRSTTYTLRDETGTLSGQNLA